MDVSMYDWRRDSTYEAKFLNCFAIGHHDSDMASCQSTDEVNMVLNCDSRGSLETILDVIFFSLSWFKGTEKKIYVMSYFVLYILISLLSYFYFSSLFLLLVCVLSYFTFCMSLKYTTSMVDIGVRMYVIIQ